MKRQRVRYSQDVDVLMIELSDEGIAYAEDEGRVILHYSDRERLVLIEIIDFQQLMSDRETDKLILPVDAEVKTAIPVSIGNMHLLQLRQAIASSDDLSEEDRTEALEQVQTLAAAAQNPGQERRRIKRAIAMLRGIAAPLPQATKLVEEFNKLLPEIPKVLGVE